MRWIRAKSKNGRKNLTMSTRAKTWEEAEYEVERYNKYERFNGRTCDWEMVGW